MPKDKAVKNASKGYGSGPKSPGNGRGVFSSMGGKSPAPAPRLNSRKLGNNGPESKMIQMMKDKQYNQRESNRGMGQL